MAIYDNIRDLVNDAIADSVAAIGGFEYNPPPIIIPAVEFSTSLTATLPASPSYLPATFPETVAPTGALDKAAYTAASSVIGSLSVGTFPAKYYATPVYSDPLPTPDQPQGVGPPPEAGFIAVQEGAGLTDIPAPVITVGERSVLQEIPLLDYEVYGFEKLTTPVPDVRPVPSVEELSNPDQLVVQLDPALLDAIQTTLDGQDLLPILPELFEIDTEDGRRQRVHEERLLFIESAAKGFSDSNGPLFEKLADLEYEAMLPAVAGYEKSRDEIYQIGENKLKQAVRQAIALETANFAVHLSYASKLIEVYEVNLKLHADLFNIVADMFQLQLQGVNAQIDAYNTYVRTVLAEQRAVASEIESFQAQVRTDNAEIDMYEAQIKTTEAQTDVYVTDINQETLRIDEYVAYIQGLMKNVEIVRLNIDAYQEALRAFTVSTKADSAIIDAYSAQIRTEGSAIDVYRENWDLYSAAYAAIGGQNNAVQQYNTASLAALRSEISVFSAAASQQRAYLEAIGRWVSANNSVASDYERGVQALARFYTGKNAVEVDLSEATSRIQMAQAALDSIESSLAAQRDAAQAVVNAGLLASEANTYAGQAQAAYAIRSVQTQLGSTATDSDKQGYSNSASEGRNYRRTYSNTKRANVSV